MFIKKKPRSIYVVYQTNKQTKIGLFPSNLAFQWGKKLRTWFSSSATIHRRAHQPHASRSGATAIPIVGAAAPWTAPRVHSKQLRFRQQWTRRDDDQSQSENREHEGKARCHYYLWNYYECASSFEANYNRIHKWNSLEFERILPIEGEKTTRLLKSRPIEHNGIL